MMIQDDGKRITVQSKPWLLGKIFAVVFTLLAVAFPLMLVASLFRPGKADLGTLVPYSVVMPFIAWMSLRLWVTRDVEIDRVARTVRIRYARPWSKTDDSLSFGEIVAVNTFGAQWRTLSLEDTGGRRWVLLFVPRSEPYGSQLEGLATQLRNLVGNIKAA